ncbi:MAG TPA: adenylate/guanylate cyclase domain-containing protein [Candidatus Limnocylindrales bacterium]|nr:adenylate/guanylate cyclase domain-containing protein [Candidatus Limnocylindrales bacterium]
MAEERRLVTILFADVTGSTALGEELDPEDARVLMAGYFEKARDVIERHGGTVQKFIGDAVMAVFGMPQAHGDDAERALAAALLLRSSIAGDPELARLRPHVGVNTGEALTSSGNQRELLVTGDAVNVAARLQQAARPEEILAGERTRRAAPSFVYGEPRQIDARGKAAPLAAWPVVRQGAPRRVAATPFLGREADLEQLHLVARRCFSERRPYLVTITAPAGTGKTRLLEEFLAQLRGRHPEMRAATAQCLPYGQSLTYWPMRAVLSTLGGIDFTGPVDHDEIQRRVMQLLRQTEDATARAGMIAMTVAPHQQAQPLDSDRIFSAWQELLERMASSGPLVLAFEDLHWASDSLLDLVDYVMQPRSTGPLLILSIARPELLDRRPHWGGGRRNYLNVALEPLDDGAIGTLVDQLLEGAAPESLRRLVVERADGNPFFAGEMVRAIMDRQLDLEDDSAVARAVGTMPETVHGTVLARLDLLSKDERTVLEAGAVMGRSFSATVVEALTGRPPTEVAGALRAMALRDLVMPGEGDRYTFRHILIREVAYQTLPRAKRAQDHAAVAALLERTAAGQVDQVAELIALHYLEATKARLGLTLAGSSEAYEAVRKSAITWLARAARLAVAAGASPEAAQQLRDAIALATPDEELQLQEQLGRGLWMGNDAAIAFERAIALWRQLGGDPATGARLIGEYLTVVQRWQGSVAPDVRPTEEVGRALNDEALTLAQRAQDDRVLALVLTARAFFPFWSGDHAPATLARSLAEAERAHDIYRRLDDPNGQSGALDAVCSALAERNEHVAAYERSLERNHLLPRLTLLLERLDCLQMVGTYAGGIGRLEESLEAARSSIRECSNTKQVASAWLATAWASTICVMTGRWDEAIADALRIVREWHIVGRPWAAIAIRGEVCALDVARRRGDDPAISELIRHLQLAIPSQPAGGPRGTVNWTLRRAVMNNDPEAAATLLETMDAAPAAIASIERGLSFMAAARFCPASTEDLDARLASAARRELKPVMAQLYRLRSLARGGDVDDLREARTLLRSMGMVPDAALTELELGALTGDRDLIAHARQDLARLGDQVGMSRADELAARP